MHNPNPELAGTIARAFMREDMRKKDALAKEMKDVLEKVLETFGTNASERRRSSVLDEVESVLVKYWDTVFEDED